MLGIDPTQRASPLVRVALPVTAALQQLLFDGVFAPRKPVPKQVKYEGLDEDVLRKAHRLTLGHPAIPGV